MPTNDFVPFCPTFTGSNLLTQSQYLASPNLPIGNQPGVASSKLNNKALRQATYISAAFAQFIVNQTGQSMLDDANMSEVLANLQLLFNPPEVEDGNSGAAFAIDFSKGPAHALTLNNNCTLTLNNPLPGTAYVLSLTQDATGSRTVTWPGNVIWPGGVAPVLTTTPNQVDMINLYYNGTNFRGSYAFGYTA